MGSASAASLPTSAGAGKNLVLILDFGSQYTHLITRHVLQLVVLSLRVSSAVSLSSLAGLRPRAVVLSGGPHSVHASSAPSFPEGFLDFAANAGAHVLDVCYGMQLLVHTLGGAVEAGVRQEYRDMEVDITAPASALYAQDGKRQSVWMSHGDEVVRLPERFEVVARSVQGAIAVVEHQEKRFYGLQYHPEGQDSLVHNSSRRNYMPMLYVPYRYQALCVRSFALPVALKEIPLVKSASSVLTRDKVKKKKKRLLED